MNQIANQFTSIEQVTDRYFLQKGVNRTGQSSDISFEEILRQRYDGVKNEKGVYVTPAFPKLVYVLDEHNCLKGGKYDYLTKLAVKCSAKRMYP